MLEAYPVTLEIPVAWGDMDAFGHVNNTIYLRWFEGARIAYFDRLGLGAEVKNNGCGPILAETRCRFRIPLTYPDTVTAAARVDEFGDYGFSMHYAIVSRRAAALAAEGSGRIVWFDYRSNSKTPLPEEIRGRIHALENR